MKVSLKWLKEYVDAPTDVKAFCDKLDMTGTGVEGVDESGASFSGVYVGQIVEKNAHPDSDHLWVTRVDVGERNVDEAGNPEPLQIVCGAQNFNQGDKIPVALVGAVLPGDFKIKKSRLRGQTSFGMNCSERELGLGGDHEGIMILPEDAPLGVDFAQYMGLADTILDLEITPNRPDCLSMEGMAREVGAMYKLPVADVCAGVELAEAGQATSDLVDIRIDDAERCPRYTARVIKNVKIGPSPDWLAERVTAAGSRPINNVVDITNYVLFLLGQPLHAFDFDKLLDAGQSKAHIVVRAAQEGEKFTTLDGEERTLAADMTVIATESRAVALAGVMGGLDSEVTEDTTTILLEAATFSPGHTSRTSRNLGLFSESSMRYERTVDAHTIERNANFAAALIAQLCGGEVCTGIVDEWPAKTEPRRLQFRVPRFQAMMGEAIPTEEVIDTLQRLGCTIEGTGEVLDVVAPTFRPDLEREIDLYEEVLRLYGMDRITPTLPGGRGRIGMRSPAEHVTAKLHNTLRASGMNETMTYSFGNPADMEALRMSGVADASGFVGEAVELINPINADQSVMRQSLIPGLLRNVDFNQKHGSAGVQLYEVGNVFHAAEGSKLPKERTKVAGVLVGPLGQASWNVAPMQADFFDAKGVVENVIRELAIPKANFKALDDAEAPHLQPGRAARVFGAGAELGWIGEIHPLAVKAYDCEGPVAAFELDLDALVHAAREARDYQDVPELPAVSMDVAFVVDEQVTHEMLEQRMRGAGGKLLASVRLFDVYRDEKRLGAGKKSMAYALEYRAPDRTLTSEEAEKAHAKLVSKVCGSTGAQVRG